MALAAISMVMATNAGVTTPSTFVEIKAEVDLLPDSCSSLSQYSPSEIVSVDVSAQIAAQIQAIVAVFVDLKVLVQAYVGVLAVVEVDAIVEVLVSAHVYLKIAIEILVQLQIAINASGGNTCGQDLLDLNVSIQAFVEAFLEIVPDESQDSTKQTCQDIQDTATQGCSAYGSC